MTYFASCFLVALLATLLIMRSSMRHGHLSADHDLDGPQKFHSHPVPRVGGVGIMAALVAGGVLGQLDESAVTRPLWLLIACSLPAFVAGITEDLTKNVSPRRRLVATAMSASLGIWLLGAVITGTDIPGVDQLIRWLPFAVLLTVLVITGVANAVNIIDGFNGLASMCVLMCLASVVPSLLWWHSTAVLSWFLLLFVVPYLWLYTRIVRFKTPRWLIFRRHR